MTPSDPASERSNSKLIKKLQARITKDGPINVASFMGAALGDADGGYYMSKEPFGRGGDFTTAPEISQMFGELVGLWAAEVWLSMDAPQDIALVELGPGRGTMMADIMRTLSRALPALHSTLGVHLVEMSPRLRARQEAALAGKTAKPVTWHDSLESLPEGPALIIANEFFDALPIRQFVKSGKGWHERLVGLGAGGDAAFGFCLADKPEPDTSFLPQDFSKPVMVETIAEIRPGLDALLALLGQKLKDHGGGVLVIDYGHETSDFGDTFQAVKNHQPSHVLYRAGEADLTAHVDFEALTKAARKAGFRTTPVTTQGAFLKTLGIETRAEKLCKTASNDQARAIEEALTRLTDPGQMGALFKAVALHTPNVPVPPGFPKDT